jgi:hypothetical protein
MGIVAATKLPTFAVFAVVTHLHALVAWMKVHAISMGMLLLRVMTALIQLMGLVVTAHAL